MSNIVRLEDHRPKPRRGGNKKGTRRRFGNMRQLPSGRWQASYLAPDNSRINAPTTFERKGDAEAWLDMHSAAITEHRWRPPAPIEPGKVKFSDYAEQWLAQRELGPRTRSEYRRILDGDRLAPFMEYALDQITPEMIKSWWTAQGTEYPTARRRAYDLLHAILATATRPDEDTDAPPLLATNPARLSARTLRAATGKARIKPATLAELDAITEAMPERYRAMVALAAWCAPRFGELTELRRKDVSLDYADDGSPVAGTLHVTRAVAWIDPDTPVVKEPKSDAGIRDIAIPPHILPTIQHHLDNWTAKSLNALLFPAVRSGGHMKHGALYKVFRRARDMAGRPDLRWHDLRHTGATMAAHSGATLAELMNRLGHSDVRAAMIYQHLADGRDAEVARRMSQQATQGEW